MCDCDFLPYYFYIEHSGHSAAAAYPSISLSSFAYMQVCGFNLHKYKTGFPVLCFSVYLRHISAGNIEHWQMGLRLRGVTEPNGIGVQKGNSTQQVQLI